jgi:hypothetical protein
MSFSYDPTRLDIPRNQLRLMLGNEGTTLETFQDEELDYILKKNNNDMNWSLYDCYKMCAVKYGSTLGDSLKIGDITIADGKNKANYFKNLADNMKEDILSGEYFEYEPDVILGGVWKSSRIHTEVEQAKGDFYPSFDNQILYAKDKTTDDIGRTFKK